MPNDSDGKTNEQQAIEQAKQVIEDSNSTDEEREQAQQVVDKAESDTAEREKLKAERKDKAYQDQLKAETAKVANGEKELSQVPEWLKEEVEQRIKKLAPPKEITDEDKIVERIKVETQLESDKELLSEDESKELQEAYDDFKAHGYTLSEARAKAKRQLGILTYAEKEKRDQIEGMRAIPAGGSTNSSSSSEFKRREQSFMDSLPTHIKELAKKAKE